MSYRIIFNAEISEIWHRQQIQLLVDYLIAGVEPFSCANRDIVVQ